MRMPRRVPDGWRLPVWTIRCGSRPFVTVTGRAHTPQVAAVRRSDGGLLMNPVRRDTAHKPYAIVRGLGPREACVRLHHERVLQG